MSHCDKQQSWSRAEQEGRLAVSPNDLANGGQPESEQQQAPQQVSAGM